MTIPLKDDTKATLLAILRELRKSLPNSGPDDVAAIMYLHDRVTECDQGRTLAAYVEAAHADPVAVRITGAVKKMILLAVVTMAAQVAAPTRVQAAEPITQDATIFTVIERIDGDQLTLRMLHSVMSRNAETILFVGDEIHATLEPLLPGRTRRGGCVTAILGQQGQGRGWLLPGSASSIGYPGCLARVQDFRGAVGLPVDRIAIDTVTTIMLNGDLVMDGPGDAPLSPPYCSYDVDFLNKTWQPFRHMVDGQARNMCEPDGPPRRMEHVACRLDNLQGTQWVFIAHDHVIQASACEPSQGDSK